MDVDDDGTVHGGDIGQTGLYAVDRDGNSGDVPKGYDERMLYRLIANSNLPLPPVGIVGCHGIHLGAWRDAVKRLGKPQLDAKEKNQLAALLADEKLMNVAEECAKKLPLIKEIFKVIRNGAAS